MPSQSWLAFTHLHIRSQWSSGNVPDCSVTGPKFESHRGQLHIFLVKTTTIYTLTAVPRSTQPSTLCGMVKWVSAFGLSNNNKWRWWVWLLAAYRPTGGLTARVVCLVWGSAAIWRHSTFIIWTGWTLAVTLSYDDSTINIIMVIIIIILLSKPTTAFGFYITSIFSGAYPESLGFAARSS